MSMPFAGQRESGKADRRNGLPFLKSSRLAHPRAVTWTGGVIVSAFPGVDTNIGTIASAASGDNILVLELDDFHLSLGILFY